MTCQECELLLAGENPTEVDDHLAACAACREFAVELRRNAETLRSMAAEPMPQVHRPQPVRWPARLTWVAAAAAIAAMIILMFMQPKVSTPSRSRLTDAPRPIAKAPEIQEQAAPIGQHIPGRVPRKNVQPQILQVKMLTDDPEVVIYWQVEN